MSARKVASSDVAGDAISDNQLIDDDTLGWPSSSPDKKPLTGKALLESGLVGLWKDRTDIADTLEYVQRLKDQGRTRRQKRIRKHMQG